MRAAPFAAVLVLTRRIRWFDMGEHTNAGQHYHAWVVFDYAHPPGQGRPGGDLRPIGSETCDAAARSAQFGNHGAAARQRFCNARNSRTSNDKTPSQTAATRGQFGLP